MLGIVTNRNYISKLNRSKEKKLEREHRNFTLMNIMAGKQVSLHRGESSS